MQEPSGRPSDARSDALKKCNTFCRYWHSQPGSRAVALAGCGAEPREENFAYKLENLVQILMQFYAASVGQVTSYSTVISRPIPSCDTHTVLARHHTVR